MSNLFIEIKRPLAEQKIINNFINYFQKGEILYKSKEYHNALEKFRIALNYLNDIWDEYPKIWTLFLIMKSLFHTRNFGECLSLQEEILGKIKLERKRDQSKKKQEKFIKIEAKIDVYTLLINFIFDNASKSVDCILYMIKYLSEESNMALEEKILYFWNYLKSFIQLSGITKTNKFKEFKEQFNSMITTNKKKGNNISYSYNIYNECIFDPLRNINPDIIDSYKSLMSNKLKNKLYLKLDKEYFFFNFGIENDKVVNFLQKNMPIYIQENNKHKLLQLFNSLVVLGKIDLKKKFGMTMNEMINVQKSRIEVWDTIFSNLIGGFQHIFKNSIDAEKNLYLNKTLNNENKVKLRPKTGINNMNTIKGIKSVIFNLSKPKEETKKEIPITSFEYFNIDKPDIKIPVGFNKIQQKDLFSKLINKNKTIKIKSNTFRKNKTIDYKLKLARHSDLTFNKNIHDLNGYLSDRNSNKINKIDFPFIINNTKSNNKNLKINFSENSLFNKNKKSTIKDQKILNKVLENLSKNNNNINNPDEMKEKKIDLLRDANYVFMNFLINIFTPIYKIENKLVSQNENINYKKVFPRQLDLFEKPFYRSIIKSYHYKWSPGLFLKENYNSFFYYDNLLLIDNVIFCGICKNHGSNGQIISNKLSIIFPCYLLYIIIEDNLKKEQKKDINNEIYKLLKTEENSKDFKDMYLLKYFLYKFNINFQNIPLLNDNTPSLKKQINQAFYSSHIDLKNRYKIIADISSTNILSCFFLHRTVYILHYGNYEMIVGKYNYNFQEWETKTVITKTEINEDNYKIYNKIYTDKKKSNNKKKKEKITCMSNLETEKSQNNENNLGGNMKVELSTYKIEKNDKIIVVGSKGLFNSLKNDEIIKEVGKYYINNKNADEASSHLIEYAKNKSNKIKRGNIFYYYYDKINKKYDKEKERLTGYYNDFACIIIFLE